MSTFTALINSITNNCFEYEDSVSPQSSYSTDFPTCFDFNIVPATMEYSIPPDFSTKCFMLNEPILSIENEIDFKQQLRFRYESEKGKHGGVKPIIKLTNYNDDNQSDIIIKASLYVTDQDEEHVFDLSGKDCKDGFGWKKLGADYTAKFSTLSICAKKRDEALKILLNRRNENQPDLETKENLQAHFKHMQNSVRLCFEALVNGIPICNKIFSKPIYNQRNAGELKIVVLSRPSGKATGKDFVILLCDKISKDDTEVWFFEQESGDIIWEVKADFQKADVHHQVAIPFWTPAYKENIEKDVFIQLRRISDGYRGKAVKYKYLMDEDCMKSLGKRMRNDNIINLELWENMLSASDDESLNLSDPYLNDLLMSDNDAQPNLEIDAVITANMGALNLTSVKEKLLNHEQSQIIKELKVKINSILLNREDSVFLNLLPRLLAVQDTDYNTLLHLIVMEKNCDWQFLAHIIQFAPKNLVNISNNFKMTPLHISASLGHVKEVKILIQHGANPNLKNIDGNNCVHLTVKYNQPTCLEEILNTSLSKRKHFVQNINALNHDGYTALHLAVINESFICTKILISHKALINIPDGKSGKTALHFAFEKNSAIKSYLLSQPEIYNYAISLGLIPNPDENFYNHTHDNHPKPTECCIEMTEDESSEDISSSENEEEKEMPIINKEIEEKLCDILDSNGLWKKMGMYIIDENELDVIAELQDKPTKIILKEFKKRHEENYSEKLKNIMITDVELKTVAKQLFLM